MKSTSLCVLLLCVFLLLANLAGAHAATMNFLDLPPGDMAIPGTYQSGGVGFHLTDPGPDDPVFPFPASAFLEDHGEVRAIRFGTGAVFTLDVPAGTTSASLLFFRPQGQLAVNGEAMYFHEMRGTSGAFGGVNFSGLQDSNLLTIDLTGAVHSLEIITFSPQGGAWIIEITLVPEPSTYALAAMGVAALVVVRRRQLRLKRHASLRAPNTPGEQQ